MTPKVLNNLKSQLGSLVLMGQQLRRTITERQADMTKFDHDLIEAMLSKPRPCHPYDPKTQYIMKGCCCVHPSVRVVNAQLG
eukprot:1145672-Pelagomonas_calceolata.AAC.6